MLLFFLPPGNPAALYDRANPDWAPTLKLSAKLTPKKSEKKKQQSTYSVNRYNRVMERQKSKEKITAAKALIDLFHEPGPSVDVEDRDLPDVEPSPVCEFALKGALETSSETTDVCVDPLRNSQVDSEIQRLLTENMALRDQVKDNMYSEDGFVGQNDKVKYYTGLPGFTTLMALFHFVKDFIPKPRSNAELGQFTRLVMTLMRVKLNLPIQDLAYRFKTSPSTVSRTFLTVIHVLYVRLKHMLYWPEREELRKTMPVEFQKHFGQKTAVIIDCFEVFIQRPKNLMARAQTWSSYKHNNTVKFLIGITPQGSISFLSKAWGGRASDKYITENCGLLTKLLPGDLVLADRGFDIADSVGMCCAQVNIPSFTRGKSQLSPIDVETTRQIARVRIHVERVIGLVRNKYTMLQDKLPIDFLMCDEGVPTVDKIATVACALTNMCESVVPFN
ncbi:uncharacterized protein [Nerophis lumbriciformis]|uniref:uncharacterized protein n=1 Tax=Nerophis lumbriciformis TaxID=546530 RepID=UPI002AE05A2F|nr:uncharacterized protein LOC133610464 [Nerophis lumbriciformis]XP_061822735.1 uncharacterized protein LOC133610465 [Nerophis lumbriciformis]